MTTTDSPSKHDRIERHLQRQRGAGARNLTTSFGFSFGLPSAFPTEPFAESLRPIEPPAKRRRVTHDKTHKDEEVSRHRPYKSSKAEGSGSQCLPKHKSAPRRRIDAILEEPDTAPKIQEEDSFVKALVGKTKRGRPKKGAARDEFGPTDNVVGPPAPPAESETTSEPPKKRRGRPKKTAALESTQVPTPRDEFIPTSMNEGQAAETTAKKRGRPKKTASDHGAKSLKSHSADTEVRANDWSAEELFTANVDSVRHNTEEASCPAATANPAPRSRRRAAANAMSKVKEGFIEEELPIDRKRRDPALDVTAKKQRKTKVVAAKDSVQRSEAPSVRNTVEEQESPSVLSRVTKHPITAAIEHEQESRSARVPLATTEVNATMGSLSPAKVKPHLEKDAPMPRRRKQAPQTSVVGAGRRQRKAQKLAVHHDHELARSVHTSPPNFVHGRTTAGENEYIVPDVQRVEPMVPRTNDGNVVRSSGEDTTRKDTASSKGSLASHAFMVADVPGLLADVNQASVRQRTLVQGASTQSDKVTARNIAGNTSKEQSAPPLNPLPRIAGGTAMNRKAEVDRKLPTSDGNAEESEESIDWLFTAGTKKDPMLYRAPRPRREKRHRPSSSNTPEMDLDDMLSNIATYAAEKHRCQEPLNRGCLRRR